MQATTMNITSRQPWGVVARAMLDPAASALTIVAFRLIEHATEGCSERSLSSLLTAMPVPVEPS
jgi:hypothetical protein